MKTTVQIDNDLLMLARQAAARSGRTITALIEDALRRALVPVSDTTVREPVHLPTFGRGGVHRGVNLDNSATLRDLMDRDERST